MDNPYIDDIKNEILKAYAQDSNLLWQYAFEDCNIDRILRQAENSCVDGYIPEKKAHLALLSDLRKRIKWLSISNDVVRSCERKENQKNLHDVNISIVSIVQRIESLEIINNKIIQSLSHYKKNLRFLRIVILKRKIM